MPSSLRFLILLVTIFSAKQASSQDDEQFRIPIRLTPFAEFETLDKSGKVIRQSKPQSSISHMLRARINRPNHFFVADYHIVSTPKKWTKPTGLFSVELAILKRFGKFGAIEEKVGSFVVEGRLQKGSEFLVFVGEKTHRFGNQWGKPILDVVVGLPVAKGGSSVATK